MKKGKLQKKNNRKKLAVFKEEVGVGSGEWGGEGGGWGVGGGEGGGSRIKGTVSLLWHCL